MPRYIVSLSSDVLSNINITDIKYPEILSYKVKVITDSDRDVSEAETCGLHQHLGGAPGDRQGGHHSWQCAQTDLE